MQVRLQKRITPPPNWYRKRAGMSPDCVKLTPIVGVSARWCHPTADTRLQACSTPMGACDPDLDFLPFLTEGDSYAVGP